MNNLINQCRYYKGEEECPEDLHRQGANMLWYYESLWATRAEFRSETDGNFLEYTASGLADFSTDDGVPMTLKALFFNRYSHWIGGYSITSDREGFKNWYIEKYLQENTSGEVGR